LSRMIGNTEYALQRQAECYRKVYERILCRGRE
jgi:hypothetical protein